MKSFFIFMLLLNCHIIVVCQPCTKIDELNRKRHTIDGMTYGHPYTTFDRHNGKTFPETIETIRVQIKKEKALGNLVNRPVYSAYKLVYDHANGNLPPNAGNIHDDGLVRVKDENTK
jgi:hypothetical protein